MAFFEFVQWCFRHLPAKMFEALDHHVFWYLIANFPGADRIGWSETRAPARYVVSLLARHHGFSTGAIRQLVREGQWWDRVEGKFLGAAVTRARGESDTVYIELLSRGRHRLGKRRRLSLRERIELLLEWRSMLDSEAEKWAPLWEQLPRDARPSRVYERDRERAIEMLDRPT
jgi:hypothetical protein